MNAAAPDLDVNQELAALIKLLHETGRRLEELTAGEVDAVADRDGRAFLLQRAQEALRHSEAAKHSHTQEILRVSELRFRQLAENIHDVFFLGNSDNSQMYYVSPGYEKVWGRTQKSLYLNPKSWLESTHPDDIVELLAKIRGGLIAGFDCEFRMFRANGEMRWLQVRGFPILNEAKEPYRMAGVATDITERKEAEKKLKRLNRVYSMLSAINSLIVRAVDRDSLFKEACRIAVEAGAFKMAWIALVDPQTNDANIVTSFGGRKDYLDNVRFSSREGAPESDWPASRALWQRRPVVSNDIANDPLLVSVRDTLVSEGWKSLGCFPILPAGTPTAVLGLFAAEPDVFDAEETALLVDLTADIAFALEHLDNTAKLNYMAYYDLLTGLANRRLFLERVTQYLRSAGSDAHKLAVCLIDLERFKNINDTFGQPAGDALLIQMTTWLTENFGAADLLARVGPDQFAAVLPVVKHEEDVARLIENSMVLFMDHPFTLSGSTFRVAAKVGVALFPDDGANADAIFRNAEAALKKAKSGGDRYLFYTRRMTQTVAGRLTLEYQLRLAVENEEFVLYYQPKVNLGSGEITGAEALIRWNDPRSGLVPPARFISVLEETGLIFEVGRWALRKSIQDYLRWRGMGLRIVRIAVNVSPLQLRNLGFIAEVRHAVGDDLHTAAGLELEITESLIMEDVKHSIEILRAVRAMGVTIAIDDFGTGFSSLSYLSKLPVDTLKIDRSFITDMANSPDGLSLASTIITLGHSMKLKVVAEGVETEEQADLLRQLDCDEMQGFLFCKPVPGEIFEAKYLTPSREPGPASIMPI